MRHLVTLLLFVAAIAAYIAGSMPGALALVAVGVVLESIAWLRIFRGRKRTPASAR